MSGTRALVRGNSVVAHLRYLARPCQGWESYLSLRVFDPTGKTHWHSNGFALLPIRLKLRSQLPFLIDRSAQNATRRVLQTTDLLFAVAEMKYCY